MTSTVAIHMPFSVAFTALSYLTDRRKNVLDSATGVNNLLLLTHKFSGIMDETSDNTATPLLSPGHFVDHAHHFFGNIFGPFALGTPIAIIVLKRPLGGRLMG